MVRKVIAFWLSLVMVFSFVVVLDVITDFTPTARGTILYVNETGSGGAYTKIQDAINASKDGDTVFVYNGTYIEHVIVNKTINFIGQDKNSTVVDGNGTGDVVRIISNWVNITEFSITNSGSSATDSGLQIESNNINITGNKIFLNNRFGIYLLKSNETRIVNNNISDNGRGIFLSSSRDANITDNILTNNGVSTLDFGIYLSYSSRSNISRNTASYNGYGIYIQNSNENNVFNNTTNNNTIAIKLSSSVAINLTGNIMINDGIQVSGYLLEHWVTHEIDLMNSINGKPVYYRKNQVGGIIPSDAGQVILANCSDIKLNNLEVTYGSVGIELGYSSNNTISGNNASYNKMYGILIDYSNNNNITDNNAINTGLGITLRNSESNEINNNNVSNDGKGIYLFNSSRNNIYNNTALNVRDGIHIWESSNKNRIHGNKILLNETNGIYGVRIWDSNENNITCNNISLNHTYGIWVDNSDLTNILGNNISLDGQYGIYLKDSDKNNIEHNSLTSKGGYGIILSSCRMINITNNSMFEFGIAIFAGSQQYWDTHTIDISNSVNGKPVRYLKYQTGGTIQGGAGQVILVGCDGVTIEGQELNNISMGIQLGFSYYNNITNNYIYNNEYGIYLWSSSKNNISGNNVSSNKIYGISLFHSNSNYIDNNRVWLNEEDGILLYYSWYNDITKNNISFNARGGVYITWPSIRNDVIGNNISHNKYGVYLSFQTQGHYVYHNIFINNTNQSIDDTSNENQWHNGYPSGGNYWSDYSGVDYFKGPYQSIPGSDGIGDTNYSIDTDSVDNYPLMQPFKALENYTILKPGWNLISIPLIQNNQSLKKVLEMIDGYYDAVQWYDITDPNDPWKHNKIGKPYGNDLTEINESMGFWIYINQPEDVIFLYNGTQPTSNQTITLQPGWNMVGYPSLTSHNRTAGLNNLTFDTHVDSIWTYDAATQKWKEIGPSDYFEIGRGYWIHAKTKREWEVPL